MRYWTKKLKSLIPRPCFERPFVCDGYPETSNMIVIGENPATNLEIDWWSFWNDDSGFLYNDFITYYKKHRSSAGKRELSNTRLRLQRIRDSGIRSIETNVYKNEKLDGAGEGVPNFKLIMLFLEQISSIKAIISHGKVANEFVELAGFDNQVNVYMLRHFRQESYKNIDKVCNMINAS